MNDAADPAGWGAIVLTDGGVRFRLWAPAAGSVELVVDTGRREMEKVGAGWFELIAGDIAPGTPYGFACDRRPPRPDPASREQVDGVHGPSRVPGSPAHRRRDDGWSGRPWEEAVIYELHVGTFTQAGTFAGVIDRLDHLVDVGVTAIELMPVAQFAGQRGWGYDGVLIYAPHPAYGSPDDLRALVDAAHERGLMALLDVVYNHFGPEGNYLHEYAPRFFDPDRHTPWGAGIDYRERAVRDFFIGNALYWLNEFHFDGLRLDAIDHIVDPSSPTILEELATVVREKIQDRHIHLTTEDSRNVSNLHGRDADGKARFYTGEWNDDFHNAAHVIATGETDGYYADFGNEPWQHFARALAQGYSYQGQVSAHMGGPRGEPSARLPLVAFISFLQNHDQAGNRAFGERLVALADPAVVEVLTAALVLSPHIPLLFMGEEWGEARPFQFFADFHDGLAEAVRKGRRQEFAAFPEFSDPSAREKIPDPNALSTFESSRIDWQRPSTPDGRRWLDLYRRLLALRREWVIPRLAGARAADGSVCMVEEGRCDVAWNLTGARLAMAINLSGGGQPAPEVDGQMIYARGYAAGEGLASPGIVVRLGDGSG